jgi:hypothetical protein
MSLTLKIVAGVAIALGLYDIIIAALNGKKWTISWQLLQFGKRWPVVPFALGFLMGHFWWSQC